MHTRITIPRERAQHENTGRSTDGSFIKLNVSRFIFPVAPPCCCWRKIHPYCCCYCSYPEICYSFTVSTPSTSQLTRVGSFCFLFLQEWSWMDRVSAQRRNRATTLAGISRVSRIPFLLACVRAIWVLYCLLFSARLLSSCHCFSLQADHASRRYRVTAHLLFLHARATRTSWIKPNAWLPENIGAAPAAFQQ